MTPKEKAKELFDKYLKKIGTNCEHESYCDNEKCQYKKNTVCCVDLFTAKQCALIAVEEMIYYTEEDSSNIPLYEYWQEVKKEIEEL